MSRKKQETNYSGAFQSYGITPEEQEVRDFDLDPTRLKAGQAAAFGKARRNALEGTSGITNPYAKARAQQVIEQELADQESSALSDANLDINRLDLQRKQFLAGLRQPKYIQSGQTTTESGGLLGQILQGGLGLAASFA